MAKPFWMAICAASLALAASAAEAQVTAHVTVRGDQPGPKIERNVYGHFVEHLGRGVYEGIWVDPDSAIPNTRGIRNDVVAALKTLQVPVVRWPGGCFADDYYWRDGIGPKEARGEGVNASWGNVREPNTFGTHEFMDFLEQIGAAPYISVNVGSAGPREAQEWMQYMTAPAETRPGLERTANGHEKPWGVPYVGVGNEAWGCGGNMRVEYYVDQFRLFSSYLKTYSGPRVQLIAAGADTDDFGWTEGVMKGALVWRERTPSPLLYDPKRPLLAGISLHYYTLPTNDWARKGPSTGFGEDQWMSTMQRVLLTDDLIAKHAAIMDRYDPKKEVMLVVDEWGAWYTEPGRQPSQLYQQNTLRDAMIAAVTLNIFHKHADRVRMANLAQMVNVLQSVILTDKEKMVLTPTYHVMEMYKVHQDATSLPIAVEAPAYTYGGQSVPAISASASVDAAGRTHVSLANMDPNQAVSVTVTLSGVKVSGVAGRILTAPAMDSRNTFETPEAVAPRAFTGARLSGSALTVAMPAKSVVVLELK